MWCDDIIFEMLRSFLDLGVDHPGGILRPGGFQVWDHHSKSWISLWRHSKLALALALALLEVVNIIPAKCS